MSASFESHCWVWVFGCAACSACGLEYVDDYEPGRPRYAQFRVAGGEFRTTVFGDPDFEEKCPVCPANEKVKP